MSTSQHTNLFAPAQLPGYAGNPNNNNGWLAADDYLLGELEAMVDEKMVVPAVDEIAEQMVFLPGVEGNGCSKVIDMEEGLGCCLFGDDDLRMIATRWVGEESLGSTRLDNLEYGHGQLVKRVIQGSNAEIAAGVTIGEIGPRVLAVEGQMQVMASQMIQAVDRVEQVGVQVELGQQTSTQRDEMVTGLTQQVQALRVDVQQRDTQIQQLQTTVTEMSNRESTLMRCILGLEKRIAALERRPPGP
ncbi:hypothetical protein Tco_0033872 [Tanacetum coccineum]